ncbi:class I SAM-dependent methyltransferase [Actinomadura sediminis]|uniref:Class I SAM-dependent methyltransferase n=1 Tax=Actinomadura sediminis TaxID=1038904 RepID=A0ABW3EVA4_9ACTN
MATDAEHAPGAAGQWHHHVLAARVTAALSTEIRLRAAPRPQDRCIDLGAGVGSLAVPLSAEVAEVIAIEPSKGLRAVLAARAEELDPPGIRIEAVPITELIMPRESCDLVVSGFALHHCMNADKRALVSRVRRWLRPGGRLVIGDMMSHRQEESGSRRLRAGGAEHGGRGRIDRSAGRLFPAALHALRESPATGDFWIEALQDAGYRSVGHRQLLPGIGVVWGAVNVL